MLECYPDIQLAAMMMGRWLRLQSSISKYSTYFKCNTICAVKMLTVDWPTFCRFTSNHIHLMQMNVMYMWIYINVLDLEIVLNISLTVQQKREQVLNRIIMQTATQEVGDHMVVKYAVGKIEIVTLLSQYPVFQTNVWPTFVHHVAECDTAIKNIVFYNTFVDLLKCKLWTSVKASSDRTTKEFVHWVLQLS